MPKTATKKVSRNTDKYFYVRGQRVKVVGGPAGYWALGNGRVVMGARRDCQLCGGIGLLTAWANGHRPMCPCLHSTLEKKKAPEKKPTAKKPAKPITKKPTAKKSAKPITKKPTAKKPAVSAVAKRAAAMLRSPAVTARIRREAATKAWVTRKYNERVRAEQTLSVLNQVSDRLLISECVRRGFMVTNQEKDPPGV